MEMQIEFEMENEAFENKGTEIASILRQVEKRLYDGGGKILDSNGNTIGKWEITE